MNSQHRVLPSTYLSSAVQGRVEEDTLASGHYRVHLETSAEKKGIIVQHGAVEKDFIFDVQLEKLPDKGTAGMILFQAGEESRPLAKLSVNSLGEVVFYNQTGLTDGDSIFRIKAGSYLRMERVGDTLEVFASLPGKMLRVLAAVPTEPQKKLRAGIFSQHPDGQNQASTISFQNVRIYQTTFAESEDAVQSFLEVWDTETEKRKTVYEASTLFEAPNWTPDGKFLIVNSVGKLFKIPLDGNIPKMIPTGFADRLNNDHGVSPDGKKLVISHHRDDHSEDPSSTVYTVPIDGGAPKQITDKSPSYWHGWSPDGQKLVYVGARNGQYDIYKIPVDGGEEVQLTNTAGLDDGPDYSHDGQFIYFNSERSGTMCIWRMKADGSQPEQLTFDEYQDWFPHPSPDGKKVVFISFPPEVPSGDHPRYKNVVLRVIGPSGGQPRMLAPLFGGQGTINVPSWSPDGRYFAFVSYSF